MTDEIHLFGTRLDRVTLAQAVERIEQWLDESPSPGCRYVVTPNLDHVVELQQNADFQAAYRHAHLVLADGWPLVAASRWFAKPLPERVAGSDLVPAVLDAGQRRGGLRVFLLGGRPGVGERAAEQIARRWPAVRVVGTCAPPRGFESDPAENARVAAAVAAAAAQVVVVGLSAPRQEIWLHRHHQRLPAAVAIGAGATIDFLAGVQTRAPRWAQRVHLEWLWRWSRHPRRLTRRYVRDAVALPGLLWREWRGAKLEGLTANHRPDNQEKSNGQ